MNTSDQMYLKWQAVFCLHFSQHFCGELESSETWDVSKVPSRNVLDVMPVSDTLIYDYIKITMACT